MLVGALTLGLWIGQRTHQRAMASEDAILYALIGVSALLVAGFLLERRRAPDAIDSFLAAGYCPACAYDIHGIPPTGEFLECPECGAGWRPSRGSSAEGNA